MEIDLEVVFKNVKALYNDGLYESAEMLGTFLLSNSKHPGPAAEVLELFADCLFAREEWARATTYYQKAVLQLRSRPQPARNDDARLRFKIVKSLLKQGDTRQAYAVLEAIPAACRTAPMWLLLGKHQRAVGNDRAAISCFRETLSHNQFALEAVLALLELGETPSDIRQQCISSSSMQQQVWLEPVIAAHYSQAHHLFTSAASSFSALDKKYPNNLHIIEQQAKCETQVPNGAELARRSFERLRMADAQCMHSMDVYASLLKSLASHVELSRLSHDLLRCNPRRPEAWVATALYAECQGQKDQAMDYVDRALELDERHVLALLLKANVLLAKGQLDSAAATFRRASAVRKDLVSFAGLARCHLLAGRVKDALLTAADARRVFPQSAGATALVGMVMSHVPDKRKQARQFFDEALRLDRRNIEAVQGLVQLLMMEDKFQDAEKLLREQLALQMRDVLVARLADVLVMMGADKYDEALAFYSAALSLNPLCETARIGKERLEKIMKGEDPDAEEQEKDDAPEDDEEVEFEEAEEEEIEEDDGE
eukprot:TRINITY_DN31419_c0_g1_i1.p1 TRINITY_DN31419_c0_g1~~TRINITY_DN31419_c0_g1_i1.p1  ORF type:complete len:542 (-),score=190.00 TRINITY_DN31419_c0_g1_i1:63-1688(-)